MDATLLSHQGPDLTATIPQLNNHNGCNSPQFQPETMTLRESPQNVVQKPAEPPTSNGQTNRNSVDDDSSNACPPQNGSSTQHRKSAIPRLLPSGIPRLQSQLSTSTRFQKRHSTTGVDSSSMSPSSATSPVHPTATDRSRLASRPMEAARADRSVSERAPRRITSKVNSLKNAHHKPGGGNVTIVNEKVKLGPITSKCNSLANVKHKPGGGNVQIVDAKIDTSTVHSKVNSMQNVKHVPTGGQVQILNEKLNFSERATSKVSSLSNIHHKPSGGNVQILSEKLEFDKKAKSKVGSMQNARHQPGGGDVQIYNETLPWLKYNKPNLPPEEKARINKRRTSDMSSSVHSGSTALSSNSGRAS